MAAVTPRIIFQNFVLLSGTVATASSTNTTYPAEGLRDPLRSKRWRSTLGWNIDSGFNDKLDFDRGGVKVATLTAGNYATGALMATEIQTQLNTADSGFTVTYSTSTDKFTISRGTTFSLLWNTGTNAATSCGLDIGFDVSADDTSASSYTGDNVAYHSREWTKFDLGTSLGVKFGAIIDYNLLSGATVTLQGNATDSWSSPTASQTLTGDSTKRLAFFSEQVLRWWRIVVEDVQNADGFTEYGVPFISSYTETARAYARGFTEMRNELSDISLGDQGSHYVSDKPTRKGWRLEWPVIDDSDRASFETVSDNIKTGRPFFFAFDPLNDSTDTHYVFATKGMEFQHVSTTSIGNLKWNIFLSFAEALG